LAGFTGVFHFGGWVWNSLDFLTFWPCSSPIVEMFSASCYSIALFSPFKLQIDSLGAFAALTASTLGSLFFFLLAWQWVDCHHY